jgi:hypothetical protein
MKNSEKEVYVSHNSYCKVGKITAKKTFEESETETEFEKLDEKLDKNLSYRMI